MPSGYRTGHPVPLLKESSLIFCSVLQKWSFLPSTEHICPDDSGFSPHLTSSELLILPALTGEVYQGFAPATHLRIETKKIQGRRG